MIKTPVRILLLVLSASILSAHRVNIFTKVENKKIVCQCFYNDGKPVKEQPVQVTTAAGAIVAQGSTDSEGLFSFSPTVDEDLTITLTAGMGHAATTTISKDLLPPPSDTPVQQKPSPPKSPAIKDAPIVRERTLDEQQIRDIIEQVVDQKMNHLADLIMKQQRSQSLTAIIGGIGYIIGIFGLLMFLKSRRTK